MAIEGFDDFTYEMSEYEKEEVKPYLLMALKYAIGKERALTNKRLVNDMYALGIKSSGPRVRHIIHCIRMSNEMPCLVATSKGYYITDDVAEMESYLKSLDDRIKHICNIRHSIIKQMNDLKIRKSRVYQPELF